MLLCLYFMYSFPQLIKKIREESDLTQKQLASVLDVSTVLISMIETGQKDISKNFIEKLAEKLEVHPGSITPFIFMDEDLDNKNISGIEKKLINIGEKLQIFLIENRAKKLKQYVATK